VRADPHGERSVLGKFLQPELRSEPGDTGNFPVPSGHWPDGTGVQVEINPSGKEGAERPSVPRGESPRGTGESPVPALESTSEFGFNWGSDVVAGFKSRTDSFVGNAPNDRLVVSPTP
jgi:hypothetical protein